MVRWMDGWITHSLAGWLAGWLAVHTHHRLCVPPLPLCVSFPRLCTTAHVRTSRPVARLMAVSMDLHAFIYKRMAWMAWMGGRMNG